ncbi:MAG: hypothetical protein COT85_07770 [Chlamydiae bacterium CG10_big_fil_rev_8_21_14_0_10_42_34]|nr:MAG: hypothetical protein COT85_07770 [Chlamydiae bacterium CG10_big_fil_rev_8_21_14_0_10_42_34]
MDYSVARKKAFRLLSMRTYHSTVLFRKLEEKGCSKEVCEKVIQDCKRLGFLKDDEVILSLHRRGYGPRYIEFKLRLPRQEVRALITRSMQKEKVLELKSKLGSKEKAMRTLQRKGFDLDIVIEIFSYQGVD